MIDDLIGLGRVDQATQSPVVADLLPGDYRLLDLTAVGWPTEGGGGTPGPGFPDFPIRPVLPAPVVLPPLPPTAPNPPITPPIPPIPLPEPGSWAMMMLGFGLIGAAARSRRNAAVGLGTVP